MNKEKVAGWIQQGFYAAIFILTITTVVTIYSIFSDTTEGFFRFYNDPAMTADILIVAVLAFFLRRKSRFAASVLLIYYLLSKYMTLSLDISSPNLATLILPLIITFFLARATYATFTYHRIERLENPDYKKPSKKGLFIGLPILVIFIFGAWLASNIPSILEVMKGKEISSITKNELAEAEVIKKGENIDFFYSYGVFDMLEEGVVFTDDYLIYYITEEDKTKSYRLPYSNMKEIRIKEQGDYFNDTIIEINFIGDEEWIPIYLSNSLGRDMEVFNKIKSVINQ